MSPTISSVDDSKVVRSMVRSALLVAGHRVVGEQKGDRP